MLKLFGGLAYVILMSPGVRANLWVALLGRLGSRLKVRRVPPNVICSPGGVATTTLISHVSKFTSVNTENDRDGLKHLPSPSLVKNSRVMLVTGQPGRIVESLSRRGYLEAQAVKLQGLGVLRRAPDRSQLEDRLVNAVRDQEERFSRDDLQVLVVRYEDLPGSAERIAHFFEVSDPAFVRSYPIKEVRA